MNQLDEALKAYLQDETAQENYYRLLLASDFYIPVQTGDPASPPTRDEPLRPMILASEGKHYMPLFDSEERLNAWAGQPIPYAIIAGHLAAAITTAGLHWAINLGSGFAKELVPEELAYLQSLPVPAADRPAATGKP